MAYLEAIRVACEATIAKLAGACRRAPSRSILGGDHSIAMGSVTGASRRERTGVIWVDAHGDFNTTETSPSGNIHGMPLRRLCGVGDRRLVDLGWPGAKIRPEDVVLIGVRDLDGEERRLHAQRRRHRLHDEGDRPPRPAADRRGDAGAAWAACPRLHVSFDADVLDPEVAPGVGTPVPGGLTYREAHLLMELFADSGHVTSLDLVEVNPILDRENRTANTVVELAASLLGKSIL